MYLSSWDKNALKDGDGSVQDPKPIKNITLEEVVIFNKNIKNMQQTVYFCSNYFIPNLYPNFF